MKFEQSSLRGNRVPETQIPQEEANCLKKKTFSIKILAFKLVGVRSQIHGQTK